MPESTDVDLKALIRDIPDFPKPGILFRDISPLLASPAGFRHAIDQLCAPFESESVDLIVGAEARGFIFAPPMAMQLGVGFAPVRKSGKLPGQTHRIEYDLEYGEDSLEIHIDGVQPKQRVLVVDDLLATGGTVDACCRLIERAGAHVVGCAFLIELTALGGTEKLSGRSIHRVLEY